MHFNGTEKYFIGIDNQHKITEKQLNTNYPPELPADLDVSDPLAAELDQTGSTEDSKLEDNKNEFILAEIDEIALTNEEENIEPLELDERLSCFYFSRAHKPRNEGGVFSQREMPVAIMVAGAACVLSTVYDKNYFEDFLTC